MSMFSSPSRTRSKNTTSTTTGGSALGEGYGSWGLDQYQGMMDPTAYTGNVPGTQGPNAAQQQQLGQYDMLSGTYGGPGGRWDTAYDINRGVAGMGANAYNIGDRSGGPDAGYINPFSKYMKLNLKTDFDEALAMMKNRVGEGASSAFASGSDRQGVAEGVGGARAMKDYTSATTGIDYDVWNKAMGYQYDDQTLQAKLAMQANQDKYNFGNLNLSATDRMSNIDPQLNLASAYGKYGLNQQDQSNLADYFNYGEFNRQQNWKPEMMNNYFAAMGQTPWQTDSTTSTGTSETGTGGKSPFDKAAGYAGTAASLYLAYKAWNSCIPEGTKIDTPDGKVPIEDIKTGMKIKGWHGGETEVLMSHQYKEDPKQVRFYHITFDNGGAVDCCDTHRIYGKRAMHYKTGDMVQSHKVTSITKYNDVKRSYDLLTEDDGYRIGNIPVDSMIEEMENNINKFKKAA